MPTPRHEDESFLSMLRRLQKRVERLESEQGKTRQNDIRLGNMRVTTESVTNRVCVENVKTGDIECFGGLNSVEWSVITTTTTTLPEFGPPFVVNATTFAKEISLTAVASSRAAAINITVHLPNGVYYTLTLPTNGTKVTLPIAIPVKPQDIIYPEILNDTSLEYITVQILFGQPAGYEL